MLGRERVSVRDSKSACRFPPNERESRTRCLRVLRRQHCRKRLVNTTPTNCRLAAKLGQAPVARALGGQSHGGTKLESVCRLSPHPHHIQHPVQQKAFPGKQLQTPLAAQAATTAASTPPSSRPSFQLPLNGTPSLNPEEIHTLMGLSTLVLMEAYVPSRCTIPKRVRAYRLGPQAFDGPLGASHKP